VAAFAVAPFANIKAITEKRTTIVAFLERFEAIVDPHLSLSFTVLTGEMLSSIKMNQ
jgi:hypothetical protein